MKQSLLLIIGMLLCTSICAQLPNTCEVKAVKLIEEAFKNMNNAWDDFKLIKHDKIDTLYILPTESKEYILASNNFENIKEKAGADSTNYYVTATAKAMKDKNEKMYQYYQKKVDEWQVKDANNIHQVMADIANSVVNYTKEQKGWKMRCRILSNNEEENVEIHFDLGISQITDILTAQYALIYEKMQNVETPEIFLGLKKRFDNRKKL